MSLIVLLINDMVDIHLVLPNHGLLHSCKCCICWGLVGS